MTMHHSSLLEIAHPQLTRPDLLVWKSLKTDIDTKLVDPRNGSEKEPREIEGLRQEKAGQDGETVQLLQHINDPSSNQFESTIFTGWDQADIALWLNRFLIDPYTSWAKAVVRRPTDVVFLNHILLYLGTSVPSALYLFISFSWQHALIHWLMTAWYCGPFTLMLHNHIHNNGVLAPSYHLFDHAWPYVLSPLMGHTWNSYYYHHVKHHHVENNGPGDLSSTLRYQRDDAYDFMCYVLRFITLIWIELPLYFKRKRKTKLAIQSGLTELLSYAFICLAARINLRASIFVFIIPLIQMRIGMMVGNWGQHALIDEAEPDSDYRSSITLIDVPSNRHCFNDGYHTSHHLNPRRHWRDHPAAFLSAKSVYAENQALVFQKIDYVMMTITLLRKDYTRLAACLVPIGDQIGLSQVELAEMLRQKTKKFNDVDILKKYGKLE